MRVLANVVLILIGILIVPTDAIALQLSVGDLLVSGTQQGIAVVNVYHNGSLAAQYSFPDYSLSDLNFGRDGNVYLSAGLSVLKLGPDGSVLATAGPDTLIPQGLAFDNSGDLLVADSLGQTVRRYGPFGSLRTTYDLGGGGPKGIDLAADQCTLYFTDFTSGIRRWDLCLNQARQNVPVSLPFPLATAIRVLPEGTLLVADGIGGAIIVTADGSVVRSFPVTAQFLALTPTGTSF
jgi:hypothetical protein